MKIAIVPSWYPSESAPEAGVFFRDQARALVQAGHSVTVIDIELLRIKDCLKKKHFRFVTRENDEGVDTYRYCECSFGAAHIGLESKVLELAAKRAFRLIRGETGKFDVVHAHSFENGGFLSCKCRKELGCPIVITEHLSTIGNNGLTKKEMANLAYSVTEADEFICVSKDLRRIVQEKTGTNKRIRIIPNMISDLFYYDKNSEKTPDFSFVAAGRLTEIKQYPAMIEAFFIAFGDKPGVQLLICGEGSERARIEELVREKGLQGRVVLLGQQSRAALAKKLRESHVFVQASRSETFGVAQIEAMACGLPLIGTLNGGANELLDTYGAIAVPVGDQDAMAKAMLKMYAEYDEYDCERIARNAELNYGASAIVAELENVYLEAIQHTEKQPF